MLRHGYDESPSRWAIFTATPLRVLAGGLVMAGGLLHLQVWRTDYRNLPGSVPGAWVVKNGFPINAAVALVLGGLLIGWVAQRRLVVLASLAFTVGCMGVLVLSRTTGIFGWKETGWSTHPKEVMAVEILGAIALAILGLIHEHAPGD